MRTAFEAAGQAEEIGVRIQIQMGDDRVDLPGGGPGGLLVHGMRRPGTATDGGQIPSRLPRSGSHHAVHRPGQTSRNFLRQGSHGQALFPAHFALVGFEFSGQNTHQGRFALAVSAEQTDALAGMNLQTDTA